MAEETGLSKYIVQVMTAENGDLSEWRDVATVEVPPRTKRKTIIEKAHEEAEKMSGGLAEPGGDGKVVRVLDEDSAYAYPIANVAGPPRLVIG